ncbi:MAG: LysR family transcriptional regulator [Hungatella sp.]|nr:LysR family transcriptional regulator [Hungatella sp.]
MFKGMDYVYMVYKEQSFSKAAKKLFISQPSLSASIKRIENKIGYPIFDRSTKPLTLTECGEKYIKSVEEILFIESEFYNFVNDWGDLKIGKLVLGGSSLFSSWVLPPLIGKFTQRFPMVKVELIEESTAALASYLQNGRIDLMIDNCSLDKAIFDSSIYKKEHLLLAVPKTFEINQEAKQYQVPVKQILDGSYLEEDIRPAPLKLFEKEPFIMLKPENDTRKRAIEILQEYDIAPEIVFELDQQLTSYNITCSGMGISFISDTLIAQVLSHPNVIYYKIESNICQRNLYFYWKTGRRFTRAMEEFLKIAGADKTDIPGFPILKH